MELERGLRDRLAISTETVAYWALVLWTEFALVVAYLTLNTTTVTEPRYLVYPFVWINVGLLAVVHTRRSLRDRTPGRRTRLVAGALAAAYLAVLCLLGGLLYLPVLSPAHTGTLFSVSWVVPGWGPIVTARTHAFQVTVVPFKFAGYLALSYVLYARLLDATRALASAVFGLFSCVGCTVSLLAPLLGASAFGAATTLTWDASTVVYLLAIATLYWSREIELVIRRALP